MGTSVRGVLAVLLILGVTFIIFSVLNSIGDEAAGFLPTATAIGGAIVAIAILFIALFSQRVGQLRAAGWLVTIGAVVVVMEHGGMTILDAGNLLGKSHSRLHFFMAGIFTIIAMVLLVVVATTLLREARREGWYALLFALLVGGTFELVMGASWYPKGMPLFRLAGLSVSGWGWQWLYLYFLAWGAALVISYRPVFAKSIEGAVDQPHAA
ncbi:MAG: hypothetical protein V3W33_00385 [Gammaproteobacteria bacterium]